MLGVMRPMVFIFPPPSFFPFELILYLELLLTQHVLIVVIIFMVCLIDYNSV